MIQSWGHQSKATLALRVAFALAFSFVLVQLKLDFLESYLGDLRFRARPLSNISGQIEIILVDQKTVEHFKRIPEYSDHHEVIKSVLKDSPEALVYITPLLKSGSNDEEAGRALSAPGGPESDARALATTLSQSGIAYQITDRLFLKGEVAENKLPPPFQDIPLLPGPKTADSNLFAKDGVTRRVLIDYQGELLGHALLASRFNPEVGALSNIRGSFDVYETQQLMIDFQSTGTYPVTKFEDFIRQTVEPGRFKGKLVLIGDDLGKSLKAYVRTPFSRDASAMTLVEMHANMFDTFIKNSAPRAAPDWLDLLLTGLVSIFTVHVVLTMRPLKGIGLLLVGTLAVSLFGFLFFWPAGIMIQMSHPLLAIFLCYYFFIPYRLIIENRRSWELQQKHHLLSQVEELKTNFISMMSHDLKTPIARILGMTDLISKDASPLSPHQREALDHVRSSSDDLLRVINSILNYAQIESQGVQLHLQSRDINQILMEVVKKHEFLSKVKHIQVITELEPLFPIQVDPDLMRQIFSNLIENAIKYSPENSKVLISSEEVDGMIRIQIADQGAGISAEDQPHIFMKFFRSSNAKASPIKGSGLGLYLAKYFVELHQGRILVESSLGQGSTFTVELPLERS